MTSMGPLMTLLTVAGIFVAAICTATPENEPQLGVETECGGNATEGTISLPTSLPKGKCDIAVFRDDASNFTTLQFSSIDLKGSDTLEVFDGTVNTSNLVISIVKSTTEPIVVVLHQSPSYIRVNVGANNSGSALTATYNTTACEISQTVDRAITVKQPAYLPARTDFTCKYTLKRADNSTTSKLALSFLALSLSKANLVIKDPSINITGSQVPEDVFTSNDLSMTLSVQNSTEEQSFQANLAPITSDTVCGQIVTVHGSGVVNITLDGFPPASYDCRVLVRAGAGQSLQLMVDTLDLGYGDTLVLLDGPSSMGKTYLADPADPFKPGYVYLSSGKDVVMRFRPNAHAANRGLSIKVMELSSVNRFSADKSFSIPAADGTQYFMMQSNNVSQYVRLDLVADDKSNYTVRVYNGSQVDQNLLVTFSSTSKVLVPVVSSSQLLIAADVFSNSQPLNANFSLTAPACMVVTTASDGTFTLPAADQPADCTWTIAPNTADTGTIMMQLSASLLDQATVSVYDSVGGSEVLRLTVNNTQKGAPLPPVALSAAQWAQVKYSSGGSNKTQALQARFYLIPALCGGQLSGEIGATGFLHSPDFPSLYPLNAACKWTISPTSPTSSSRFLLFDFPTLALASDDTLNISEGATVKHSYKGPVVAPDLLYSSNKTNMVTFSDSSSPAAPFSNSQGSFSIQYWSLGCGGSMTAAKGNFSTPGYPKAPPNNTVCVWIVSDTATNYSNIKLQLKTAAKAQALAGVLTVFDGPTLRSSPMNTSSLNLTSDTLTRYSAVILLYNNTNTPNNVALQVNYQDNACNSTNRCKNGVCIHPGWRCNKVDDCGDNSDEVECPWKPPTPAQPSKNTGVQGYVVAVLFFVGLILGVLVAVIVPRIMRRMRTNRYSSFQNDPAVA